MTIKRQQAAQLLGRGVAQREVARRVGVEHSTIWRWLQHQDFLQTVEHARRQDVSERMRRQSASEKPSDRELLEAAKLAVDPRTGLEDWPTRLRALELYNRLFPHGHEPEPKQPDLDKRWRSGALGDVSGSRNGG